MNNAIMTIRIFKLIKEIYEITAFGSAIVV